MSTTSAADRLVYNTYHHVNHPNNQKVSMQYIYLHVNHISSGQVGIQHIPPCQPPQQSTGWYAIYISMSTTSAADRLIYNTYHHVNHPSSQQVGIQDIPPCQPPQQHHPATKWHQHTTHGRVTRAQYIKKIYVAESF